MFGDYMSPKTTKTERGFTIERKPEAMTPIKINAFDVFYQHMNDVAFLLKTQRDLKMIGEIARGELVGQKYGKIGQTLLIDWLDTFARQGRIGGFRRWPKLDELRKRTSAGVIGFRLASQFVHLSNIPLSMQRTGIGWYKSGMMEAFTPEGQDFLRQNFAETFTRGGGEPALVEAMQEGGKIMGPVKVPKMVMKAAFYFARQIDQKNAQATVLGHYMRSLASKGLDPSKYADLPVDREAQAQAMTLSRRSVASPIYKDVPMTLSRGALTGGNISLSRSLFQFQNIFLDQWSNIRHDLWRAGIKEKNPRLAMNMFLALSAMAIAETGIREGAKLAIETVTGYEPKKEQEMTGILFKEIARRFPGMGQVMNAILYSSSGIPVLDSVIEAPKAAYKAAVAKTDDKTIEETTKAIGAALQISGVPGSSQFTDILVKMMKE